MNSLIIASTDPSFTNPPPPPVPCDREAAQPGVAKGEIAEPAPGLTARYVLVEDVDYLLRTGKSRQVLALRWTR